MISHFKALIFLCFLLTSFLTYADESHLNSSSETFSHLCIPFDQIFISQDGIFAEIEYYGLTPIKSVTWLQDGLCLITYNDPQCRHPLYCPNCGGCSPRNNCPNRCKCSR